MGKFQTKIWFQINLAIFRIAYLLTNNFRILSSLFNSKVISLNKLFNNNKINRYLIKWIWINTIWTIWMVNTPHKTSNQTITFKILTHSYSNIWAARAWAVSMDLSNFKVASKINKTKDSTKINSAYSKINNSRILPISLHSSHLKCNSTHTCKTKEGLINSKSHKVDLMTKWTSKVQTLSHSPTKVILYNYSK